MRSGSKTARPEVGQPSFRHLDTAAWQADPMALTLPPADSLMATTEGRRILVSSQLGEASRAQMGQFFTPASVAEFIASLPLLPTAGVVRILDPGAGIGSLTAALVSRIASERPGLAMEVTAVELDGALIPELEETLAGCRRLAAAADCSFSRRIIQANFLDWAADSVGALPFDHQPETFDIVVMNPPYRKISADTTERQALQRINVDVSNLYVAFLALSCAILGTEGQIAAITPRSFANGPYFRSFRRYFFERVVFDRIHMFESRSKVFAGDAVLQENIIFSTRRKCSTDHDPEVVITASVSADEQVTTRRVPHSQVISPLDPDCFVYIVTDDADAVISETMARLPTRLPGLGLEVSTGRVVDFRSREHLRDADESQTVPLLYQGHLKDGGVVWPGTVKKPTSIVDCADTSKLLLPAETYVLVKRFTAKEERRRVAASVFEPTDVTTDRVGLENHLNVFHKGGRGIDATLARGLAVWLNSTVVDRFFRSFNGHTQVNATDLRRLPYPSHAELIAIGDAIGAVRTSDQEKVDALVNAHVGALRGRRL